ncbi:L-ascorbate metabolism protein UlaG (beta-lactamase superfamily) [Thermocatellispora tengchongensis]|uniref:L-ascorbate metabolism protein UlaG (Beta-lactamase superfamily) n=1 Tax=Thermocatellispora tengchongensis TaxID=1073253 RepID=A0A840PAT4_9ACTN|nr:MBL fold metallo-hydrolase [Thermocatellispora tengchongensis]MBB5134307.1 L-ascorbate metabolism protein UlaG (beta-lactamase superfamily) [Thermocatellispora tengchongensis]
MRIRWLGWAGVELEAQGESLVIDLLGRPEGVLEGTSLTAPLPKVTRPRTEGDVLAGLCTHLHRDHTDAGALAQALRPGGMVLHPESYGGDDHENLWTLQADAELTRWNLPRRPMAPWQTTTIGPFSIAAVPAVDALGDPQVSWAVEAGGKRVIHLGDSMFHGYWWRAAHRYGPFDAVLTPINGPTICFPHCRPPSPYPASLDAEQAAVAARLLGAKVAVPIHYDGFHIDGFYRTQPGELSRFLDAASAETYQVLTLEQGEDATI